MSHEVESMAYFGKVPWHGLGTKVEKAMTSAEAIKLAGLDWEVEKVPVYNENGKEIPGWCQVRRATDQQVYNMPRISYEVVQNLEAFEGFDAITQTKEAIYHTAGSLRKGATVWILAKLNDIITIKGDKDEVVEKYILLRNSHDGSTALQVIITPVRVVCMNTLSLAISKASNRFYARHTVRIKTKLVDAKEALGVINKQFEVWKLGAEMMANQKVSEAVIKQCLYTAFRQDIAMPMEELYTPVQQEMVAVRNLFEGEGKGLKHKSIAGSRYALYNAVAQHVDYRDVSATEGDKRLNNVWFGSGAQIKDRAWSFLATAPDKAEKVVKVAKPAEKVAKPVKGS